MPKYLYGNCISHTDMPMEQQLHWFKSYCGWHIVMAKELHEIPKKTDKGIRRFHKTGVLLFAACGMRGKAPMEQIKGFPKDRVVCPDCAMFYKGLREGLKVSRKKRAKQHNQLINELLPDNEKPWYME